MFDEHFEVFLADTQKSKEKHYGIRYQVYCEEMGFESKDNFVAEQEYDKWDGHSAHFIVRAKHTGQWIAAMRMVFKNEQPLPLEEHCLINKPIQHNVFNHSVEISRLCLIKEIRRRNTDYDPPIGLEDEHNGIKRADNVIPFQSRKNIERRIIWGLFRAAAEYSAENNIKKWYFLCTNALARVIAKEGFSMERIGEPCSLNGERIPFEIGLNEILSNSIWLNDFKKGYSLYSDMEISKTRNKRVRYQV
jgi:N-acyl amino acid synthase of PEP-CTERM/exosortase system